MTILLLILISCSLVFYLACSWFTWRFFSASTQTTVDSTPPVAIIMSVCGLEPGAWENWSSFCQQDYPDYQILFGVTDPQDPAIALLEKLVTTYPDKVQVFPGLEPQGINYKDSNLNFLLQKTEQEVIIFADSDIRVSPDYISRVIAPLANQEVGMVTCAFVGYNPRSLGAALASFGRCFDFIPSLLIARFLDGGLKCAVGTTIATRKSALAKYGGLHLNRIGSDYNLGKRAAEAGYQVELSPYVLESDTGEEGIKDVYRRELRWARTIRFNRGPQYYTMAFCYGSVYCLPLLIVSGFSNWAIAVTLVTYLIRSFQAFVSITTIKTPRLLPWLWALPLRDLLSFLIWLIGCFGQEVYWRGRKLKIEGDGIVKELIIDN